MRNLIVRLLINAVALWAAASLVGGIHLTESVGGILLVAAIFGVVNALIKPVARLLALPFIVLTLGLFTFVVNAGMLALTAGLTRHLGVDGFWAAVAGAIVISVVSWPLSVFLDGKDQGRRTR